MLISDQRRVIPARLSLAGVPDPDRGFPASQALPLLELEDMSCGKV